MVDVIIQAMNTVESTPLTDENIAQYNMPSIASQMPVTFANGNKVGEFVGKCSQCGGEMSAEHLHGSIVMHNDNSMADLTAVGVCRPCMLMVPFRYRMYQDQRVVGISRNGEWAEWEAKPSFLGRVTNFIRWLFTW